MPRYLLDTNTCIAIIKDSKDAGQRFKSRALSELMVSSVTVFELWTGVEKCSKPSREAVRVEGFLSLVEVAEFAVSASKRAAQVRAHLERAGQTIGPYDTLLAGHALDLGCTIVTHNTREFKRVPGLKVEDWVA
jgi:tRNA(fMet)-specific endonuclease VapC